MGNGLSVVVEYHGEGFSPTGDGGGVTGYFWVADITCDGQAVWFKHDIDTMAVKSIRGWGLHPTSALLELLDKAKGWLVRKVSLGGSEYVTVPDFTKET